jgi:hypothetical protein
MFLADPSVRSEETTISIGVSVILGRKLRYVFFVAVPLPICV